MSRGLEWTFFPQRRHTDEQQEHEKRLNITNYQGIQVKTMRYYLTNQNGQNKKYKKKQTRNNKCQDVEKRNPLALLMGIQIGSATVENNNEFPQKIKIEILYNPVIPVLFKQRKQKY